MSHLHIFTTKLNGIDSFHEDYPDQLVALQTKHWEPILKWAKETLDVEINLFDSILSNSHPPETKQKVLDILRQMNKWELAGAWTGNTFQLKK